MIPVLHANSSFSVEDVEVDLPRNLRIPASILHSAQVLLQPVATQRKAIVPSNPALFFTTGTIFLALSNRLLTIILRRIRLGNHPATPTILHRPPIPPADPSCQYHRRPT